MKICKRQYRIVTDGYAGFEVQKRLWYYPFWFEIKGQNDCITNTHCSIEEAEELIKIDKNKGKVVKTFKCG